MLQWWFDFCISMFFHSDLISTWCLWCSTILNMYMHSDAGIGVYLHWSDLLHELSMLYPLLSVFCLPCMYIEKKWDCWWTWASPRAEWAEASQIYRESKMQKDEDMILHVHGIRVRLTDIQTLQRILVSTKRLVFSLHLLAVDQLVCQTIAASRSYLRQRWTSIFLFENVNRYNT